MKKIDSAIRFKPAKRLECFIARDGVYAASQSGTDAAIARDGVYAASQSGVPNSDALIKEAQELRFRVFAKEMGAKLKTESEGLDYDEVDSYCDHLIVYDNVNKKIVGYTRLLNQDQAELLGRFYSQSEFDLGRILTLPGRFLEIGRTCVDPDYRGSAVLTTLWSALVQYALEGQFNYLLGCASITPGPSGFAIDAVYRNIDAKNIAPSSLQVKPNIPIPHKLRCNRDESGIPPLLKAYFRFGAMVCGEPYWDEDFNCMDLFMLLPLDQLQERYSKHYMRNYISKDGVYVASQSGTGATISKDGVYVASQSGTGAAIARDAKIKAETKHGNDY
ncbi:MAG: GNAT family N-acetyltransferase [Methylobacter sp.]|nr:GNAT family N-acetyltransferase [Methylobacter sp.]